MASQAYERRIASYLRRHPGATRQDARGHSAARRPAGTTEAGERRRKTVRKYGVTPQQLTALRRRGVAHVLTELAREGTKGPVSFETVRFNVNHMSGPMIEDLLEMTGAEIKARAAEPAQMTAPEVDYEFNPFWYHAGT